MDAFRFGESLVRALAGALHRRSTTRPGRPVSPPVAIEYLEDRLGPTSVTGTETLAALPALRPSRMAEPAAVPASAAVKASTPAVLPTTPHEFAVQSPLPIAATTADHSEQALADLPPHGPARWQPLDQIFARPDWHAPSARTAADAPANGASANGPPSAAAPVAESRVEPPAPATTPAVTPGIASTWWARVSGGLGFLAPTAAPANRPPRPDQAPPSVTPGSPPLLGGVSGSDFAVAMASTVGAPTDAAASSRAVVVTITLPATSAAPMASPLAETNPASAPGTATPPPQSVAAPIVNAIAAAPAAGPEALVNGFRVQRAPAQGPAVEIQYTIRTFDGARTVTRTGALTLGGVAGHSNVLLDGDLPGQPEVIVLTLRDGPGYRLGQRSVTLFRSGDGRLIDEAALLRAYQEASSEEAFRVLVEKHHETVTRTCEQLLGNRHDAEDVAQLVFLALAQRQISLHAPLVHWLRKVARNAARMFLRSRRRRSHHECQAARPNAAAPTSHEELAEEVRAALELVAPPWRDAVRLRYLEGQSQQEAAAQAGCPRGTLSQRAARGLRLLGDVLSRRGTVG